MAKDWHYEHYLCMYLTHNIHVFSYSLNQLTAHLNHSFTMHLFIYWILALRLPFFLCLSSPQHSIKLIFMWFNRLSESTYITFRSKPSHILQDPLARLHLFSPVIREVSYGKSDMHSSLSFHISRLIVCPITATSSLLCRVPNTTGTGFSFSHVGSTNFPLWWDVVKIIEHFSSLLCEWNASPEQPAGSTWDWMVPICFGQCLLHINAFIYILTNCAESQSRSV